MLLTLVQFILTLLMIIFINMFGSIRKGYVTIDQLLETTNLGYNLLYRILSPSVFISFASLVFYELKLPQLTKNIWIVAVYYYVLNFIVLLLRRRFALVNKLLYFLIVFLSVLLAYFIYNVALKYGTGAILPDAGNFRTELWFIILAYFYSLLNNFTPNYNLEYQRRNKFLLKRYYSLREKYENLLNTEFKKNDFLSLIFFVIMITEDINRPPFIRFIETIFFFTGKVNTTGIMQVTSSKKLSDSESINLAQALILKSYKKNLLETKDEDQLLSRIATDYNNREYSKDITNNYYSLKSLIINK